MNKGNTIVKRLLLVFLAMTILLFAVACSEDTVEKNQTKTIVDMAGREVEIPVDLQRIYAADPGSMILVYTVAPQLLVGFSYKFNEVEAEFILKEYLDLPVLGMGSQVNYEAVIVQNPQVAILSGKADDASIQKAEKIEQKIGIPVVVVDLGLFASPETYILMGDVIGDEKRGAELSDYAKDALDSIAEIPDDEQVSIYYANGVDSLDTSAKNTPASQLFDIIYANNVCELNSESGDRMQVSKEHLLKWNPDYIFVNGEPKENISGSSAADEIISNPDYANLSAVQNGNVVSIPKAPFAWVDRPRSENRLIGIKWLGSIVYPDYYDFDQDDIKEFYKLFYHMDLTDEQVQALLNQ